jgi:DNA-binding transcriptional regulator YiaG
MREHSPDLVRSLRQRLRMTQQGFAHAIGVTVSTVNRWEKGHAAPSKLAWNAVRDLARARGLIDEPREASHVGAE